MKDLLEAAGIAATRHTLEGTVPHLGVTAKQVRVIRTIITKGRTLARIGDLAKTAVITTREEDTIPGPTALVITTGIGDLAKTAGITTQEEATIPGSTALVSNQII